MNKIIQATFIDEQSEINITVCIDGVISEKATSLSQRIIEAVQEENPDVVVDLDTETIEADTTSGNWRMIVWNHADQGQGDDQPLVMICRQTME